MARQYWRPANLLNPVPAVLITCRDENGKPNVMTAAWAGTVCSDPVMVSVSIRKSRYSHDLIQKNGEFAMCLSTTDIVKAVDYVGIYSGRKTDKFHLKGDLKLTEEKARIIDAPLVKESPICLECKVRQIVELGSHDMFIAEVVSTDVDERILDEDGRLNLTKAKLIAYCHGSYYALGKKLGTFSYSSHKKNRFTRRKNTAAGNMREKEKKNSSGR